MRGLATGVVVFGMLSGVLLAQETKPGKKQVLLESDHSWLGDKYATYPTGQPQLTIIKLTIAPHSALPWHTHAIPNAGYVLKGALTVQDQKTGKSITVHEGEAFAEEVGQVHRGTSGDEETVVLLTYAGAVGVPTSTPVQGGQQEY